jgi:hypothetical protein
MSLKLQTSVYPGYEKASDDWHISSAVRIPPNSTIIAVGGQTGGIDWKFGTLEQQLTIIFEVRRYPPKYIKCLLTCDQKLDKALCAAIPEMLSGEIWKCVYSVKSYHVNWSAEQGPLLAKMLRKYMEDHRPVCTAVGVERLAYPSCLVEISVNAALPS